MYSSVNNARIYLGVRVSDNSEMGFLKLKSLDNNDNIDWYLKVDCSSIGSVCYPGAIFEAKNDYMYMAAVIEDSDSKVYTQIYHTSGNGQLKWVYEVDQI